MRRHLGHIALDPDLPESGGVAVALAFPQRSVALCCRQDQIWPQCWMAKYVMTYLNKENDDQCHGLTHSCIYRLTYS